MQLQGEEFLFTARPKSRLANTFRSIARRLPPFGTSWNLRHKHRSHTRNHSLDATSGHGTQNTPSSRRQQLHGSISLATRGKVASIRPNRAYLFTTCLING